MGFDPMCVTTKRVLRKLGGDTRTIKTVLLDGVFELEPLEGELNSTDVGLLDFKPDDKLTVQYNGKQYICVANNFNGIPCFGNLGLLGAGDNTGEPFLYMPNVAEDGTLFGGGIVTTDTGSITVTVTSTTETIVPIDPKYLLKTIDLDSYGIGQVILGLFASGGGYQEVEGVGTFWDDIATSSPLRLVQPYDNVKFEIDQSVRTRYLDNYNRIDHLCFSFMVAPSYDEIYTISVSIDSFSRDGVPCAGVYVKVT